MRLFVCLCLLSCFAFAQKNILNNSNFEKGLERWSISDWKQQKGTVEAQNGILLISNDNDKQMTMIQQSITLEANSAHRLSFRMKGEEIKPSSKKGSGALFLLLAKGRTFLEISPAGAWRAKTGSFDWITYTYTIPASNVERQLVFYPMLRNASGKVYFSDIRLDAMNQVAEPESALVTLYPCEFQGGKINVLPDFPSMVMATIKMKTPGPKDKLEIEVNLPQGTEFVGMTPWWGDPDKDGVWRYFQAPGKSKARESGGYSYRVEVAKPAATRVRKDSVIWNNYLRIYFKTGKNSRGGEASVQAVLNGNPAGSAAKFSISVMPPLPRPPQKIQNFKVLACYLFSVTAPMAGVRESYSSFWTDMVDRPMTFLPFMWKAMPPEVRTHVNTFFDTLEMCATRYTTPMFHFAKWRENHPEVPQLVLKSGDVYPEAACTTYQAEEVKSEYYTDYLKNYLLAKGKAESNIKALVWDIEPGAKDFCFCINCRQKFSDKVKAGKCLSIEEITKKHAAEWYTYRVAQNAKIIENFAVTAKETMPDLPLFLCTDPLHKAPPHVQEWCGVDVRMCDQGLYDKFMNMPYYSGISYYDDLKFNLDNLKTRQFPLIDPSENMEMFYMRYTPQKVFMNILATAAQGADGIGFWPSDHFDAMYYHRIRNALSLVALSESYYGHKRCDDRLQMDFLNSTAMTVEDNGRKAVIYTPDFASCIRHTLHRKDDAFLATIFNYSENEPLIASLKIAGLADGNYVVRDMSTMRFLMPADPKRGIVVELLPESVMILEIVPGRLSGNEAEETLLSTEIAYKKYTDFQRNANAVRKFGTQTLGDKSAGLGIVPPIRKPLVKLTWGKTQVYLDNARGGATVAWKTDDFTDINLQLSRGALDELFLYFEPKIVDFSIDAMSVTESGPSAVFVYSVPEPQNASTDDKSLFGLTIRKEVYLENNGTRLRSVYTFTNNTAGKTLPMGCRIRHYPRLGSGFIPKGSLTAAWNISIPLKDNKVFQVSSGKVGTDSLFMTPTGVNSGKYNAKVMTEQYTGGPVVLTAAKDGKSQTLTFTPEAAHVDGIMTWWSETEASTLEPLYKNTLLKPGESKSFSSVVDLK